MIRAVVAGMLALTCFACAARPSAVGTEAFGNQEGRQAGDEADSPARVRPRMLNQEQVLRAVMREYPAALREAGIGGTTVVHLFIDTEGIVRNQEVHRSSGHPMLDGAALRVATAARFSPAKTGGEPVAVWIALDITFTAG